MYMHADHYESGNSFIICMHTLQASLNRQPGRPRMLIPTAIAHACNLTAPVSVYAERELETGIHCIMHAYSNVKNVLH